MADYGLVISNPPQGDVDFLRAASCFGLTPAEVRMKANYQVPEIWIADVDQHKVAATARTLSEAGLRVIHVSGRQLGNVPAPQVVRSFRFAEHALGVTLDGSETEIAYDAPVVGVFCQPLSSGFDSRSAGHDALRDRMSHGGIAVGDSKRRSSLEDMLAAKRPHLEEAPFFDIYESRDGALIRLSVIQDVVDFSGLPTTQRRAADNMALFVSECVDRLTHGRIDRRLVGMRWRRRLTVSTALPQESRRKGFSFATPKLAQLLESISPELRDVSDPDLSSRLAYLTNRS